VPQALANFGIGTLGAEIAVMERLRKRVGASSRFGREPDPSGLFERLDVERADFG
jgi:hypothetical protein